MTGMAPLAISIRWFSRHELRLAWRDWVQLMSGGRRLKSRAIMIGMALFAFGMHWIAYTVMASFLDRDHTLTAAGLMMVSTIILLSFTMMLSQALEAVTRAFFARDDLDLILSSPASSRDLFFVRISMMALSSSLISALMIAPFINVAAWLGGAQWLAGYLVMLAVSLLATGSAVLIALALFRWVGARRTRLVAQITAAIIGATFLIGLQVVAIMSFGTISRVSLLNSELLLAHAPAPESPLWLPALAATGQGGPVLAFMALAVVFFTLAARGGAIRFGETVVLALSVPERRTTHAISRSLFRPRSPQAALMRKEIMLISRDPWLISQTLMQVLYLLPPALMLWMSFGSDTNAAIVVAPVVVMAVGQLSGGLAWLAISGEDAPDLIATAPVTPFARMAAKARAVLTIVGAVLLPVVAGMALLSPPAAAVTLVIGMISAGCALLIQLWFRAQAKRSNFRRRQVASKASTFLEAIVSILCAATAGLAAAMNIIALLPAVLVLLTMAVAWWISPRQDA